MDKKQFHERIQYFVKQRVRDEGTINSMMDMELVTADFHTKSVVLAFPVKDWQMSGGKSAWKASCDSTGYYDGMYIVCERECSVYTNDTNGC